MKVLFLLIRTLIYACLVFFLWSFVARATMKIDRHIAVMLPKWTMLIGIPVLLFGILITLICIYEFLFVGEGTFLHFDATKHFVAGGVYSIVRNPMYLGVLIIFIGYALCYHSIALLLLSLLLFLLAHLAVKFIEEPNLSNKFGEDYDAYK